MNFTSSPFERMMKEVPHPGWDNDDPCKGCRYYKECKGKKKQCRKKFRALTAEGISPELRACAVCGKAFWPEGHQAYCSDVCKAEGNRRKSRERMRKMREKRPGGCYDLPPPKA